MTVQADVQFAGELSMTCEELIWLHDKTLKSKALQGAHSNQNSDQCSLQQK